MGADWLKKRREELEFSQEKLTALLQLEGVAVSRAAVSGWETGRYNPPLEDEGFRKSLAKTLRWTVPHLLAEAGYETNKLAVWPDMVEKAAEMMQSLSREDQSLVLQFLDRLQKAHN